MLGTLLTSRRNVNMIFPESLKEFASLVFQRKATMCPTWMKIENRSGVLNKCWAWYRMGRWELRTPPGVLQTGSPWGKGLTILMSLSEGVNIRKFARYYREGRLPWWARWRWECWSRWRAGRGTGLRPSTRWSRPWNRKNNNKIVE